MVWSGNRIDQNLVTAGIILVLAGFVVGLVSFLLSSGSHIGNRDERRGGAVIIIGPIPIIFGSDPEATKALLILSIILILVVIGLFVLRVFT
jgi:uncharacterized protein (TIGR00304 family)